MNSPRDRAATAAERMLQAHSRYAQCQIVDLELAAWLVGVAGGRLPRLPQPADDLHARMAFLLGAGDHAAAQSFLETHLPEPAGDQLLFHACHLAGPMMPDALIDIAYRHPDRLFNARMLAGTSRPARLLGLFDGQPVLGHAIITIGELVIRGRDTGQPIDTAEDRWAALVAEQFLHLHDPRFRNTWLRIEARQSLDAAVELLLRLVDEGGRASIVEGANAVLARLVRQQPQRATTIVADDADPIDQVAWLEALAWWFSLPPSAEPLLHGLLDLGDLNIDLELARALTRARAPAWLERALATATRHPPLVLAQRLAPGVAQLREGGLHDDAEKVRGQLLGFLPAHPSLPDGVAPRDLFDVLSAEGLPDLVPWGVGPGLP